jgi:hypothetical protein
MHLRRILACFAVVVVTAVAAVPTAGAQNNSNQTGLVNVSLGDVSVLNNVNLGVAANIAATACNVSVPVAVLAQQVVANSGEFTCDTTTAPITIEQALNGPGGPPNAGGNNSQQQGLINVSLGDVNLLNNVNLAVAANVAATVCNIQVPVAILAVQTAINSGEAVCGTTTGPLMVTQTQ